MTDRVVRLEGDDHARAQSLLPWFATGGLDQAEAAEVAAHLAACPDCQSALEAERRLGGHVASLSFDVEAGWARLQARIGRETALKGPLARLSSFFRSSPAGRRGWLGWAMAAQAAAFCGLGATVLSRLPPAPAPAAYHVLGAPPETRAGDILVMFKPQTRAAELAELIEAAHARIVDGPTDAGGFVLSAPKADLAMTVKRLKAAPAVELAEPIERRGP